MRSEQIKNQLEIVQGDITKLDCDCIVNAANRSLLGGGGIAEAFYGMPQKLRAETLKRLPEDLRAAPFRAGAFLQGESVVY
jgi:O-acetyl-ADP-ribose deacetylase (regulator of RNase III)